MRNIEFFDTTLRDGEQSAGVNLNLQEKLEIARHLEQFGIHVIEAGFPAAAPDELEAVKRIAETIKDARVAALARAHQKDIDAAWEALRLAAAPRIHTFIATSPIHMEYKLKLSPDAVLERAVESVRYAKRFVSDVEWSAEDATRSDWDFLVKIIKAVIEVGATVINLPDTVGYTQPSEYAALFRYVQEHVPGIENVKLSAHCHDDLGLAVANSLAAIEAGVTQVEGTINGIGERAGNAALEEINMALVIRKNFYRVESTLNTRHTVTVSKLVSKLTGMVVPSNKAIVGANAFAHESGIHQDGVLKHALTYEIISPEMIGLRENRLVLGKHSGRHAFRERLKALGLGTIDEATLDQLFQAFKVLTGKKKEITDDDLLALALDMSGQGKTYELVNIQCAFGINLIPTTTVTLKLPDGSLKTESATGEGSVESVYQALSRASGYALELLDYRIQSSSSGEDALGEVYIKVQYAGGVYGGRGVDNDVIIASAKAYVDALNRLALASRLKEEALVLQDGESV
ncbi:MAG: 2-isopropylmalate synthase [Candidatus Carbobacillus altaicus]|uniref:2-isopropylmalate synthase n=1 Tax=Candidatus Carbonibacillus altaicus TaxID=2163959 RepID=A0A2R6Y2J5_9BACL|nr:2-isopropylmalate synthase [Candidatus Carbobacillus altaicus]PTQ56909.1 MAG: 2-isopropylmalate synthase [Candidatus Carbobacillus altaicus]